MFFGEDFDTCMYIFRETIFFVVITDRVSGVVMWVWCGDRMRTAEKSSD